MTFLGVPAQDTDARMQEFVDRHDLGAMTQVVDDDGDLWDRFGVRVQPAWVFVPAEGEPDAVYGGLFGDALDARIEANFG